MGIQQESNSKVALVCVITLLGGFEEDPEAVFEIAEVNRGGCVLTGKPSPGSRAMWEKDGFS